MTQKIEILLLRYLNISVKIVIVVIFELKICTYTHTKLMHNTSVDLNNHDYSPFWLNQQGST